LSTSAPISAGTRCTPRSTTPWRRSWPSSLNAWLIDRNLTLNGIDKVIVCAAAVGAERGSIRLHRYKGSNRGRHSILANHGFGSRQVPISDLDSALEGLGLSDRRVLILKIDVEGYEPAVIEGAQRTLSRTDVAIIEHSPDLSRAGGLSADTMLDRLQSAGLIPHRLSAGGVIEELVIDDVRRVAGQMDVVWIRAEQAVPA
jgi:FkbM family methyltransferase